METLRYLLSKIMILIPLLLIFAGLYWLGVKMFPLLPKDSFSGDFLPAPGSWGVSTKPPEPNNTDNLYVAGEPYNANDNYRNISYASFDSKGNLIYMRGGDLFHQTNTKQNSHQVFDTNNGKYSKGLYLRNLSIYEGGHIYTGLTFTGEAKSAMFYHGIMPITIIDVYGRVVAVEQAIAQQQWSTSGWTRFDVKIKSILPVRIPCNMIFQAAQGSPDSYNKVFVGVPEMCN